MDGKRKFRAYEKIYKSDEFVYILSGEKEETMKAYKRLIAGTAAAVMLALTCGGCGAEKEPVTITIWNYYCLLYTSDAADE